MIDEAAVLECCHPQHECHVALVFGRDINSRKHPHWLMQVTKTGLWALNLLNILRLKLYDFRM